MVERKRGRPRVGEGLTKAVGIRLDPDREAWLKARPEGASQWVRDQIDVYQERTMKDKIAFAVPRGKYVEDLRNKLHGGMGEFYKWELATYLGRGLYAPDWEKEVQTHLWEFKILLNRPTRGNFNKMKAVEEALSELSGRYDRDNRKYAIKKTKEYGYPVPDDLTTENSIFDHFRDKFFNLARIAAAEELKGKW